MKTLVVLSCLLALTTARMAYVLSSGYEEVVGQVVQGFSCEGRPYGYYADVDNACRLFHVCVPIYDDQGQITTVDQFTFMCGNQTMFSQESLTCTSSVDSFPCNEAPTLYDLVNSEFGRIPEGESRR
ncbi:uncharacterized protein LOC121853471 [Homarus americanus]|uniref:U-scoloptoxin(01)-Cw1a-like 16 n=1 Tax=Homarus americanus TaxID=6706 RepID=A0A8J5JF90_HOMAM|nr:uncharacterized protein LOC121853471 [Homarus americanus]KAG7156555.1 U-scoloptoxin(01)-Cw1a-like 16 [Homarus americanus]